MEQKDLFSVTRTVFYFSPFVSRNLIKLAYDLWCVTRDGKS
jgi:hypothetical protein